MKMLKCLFLVAVASVLGIAQLHAQDKSVEPPELATIEYIGGTRNTVVSDIEGVPELTGFNEAVTGSPGLYWIEQGTRFGQGGFKGAGGHGWKGAGGHGWCGAGGHGAIEFCRGDGGFEAGGTFANPAVIILRNTVLTAYSKTKQALTGEYAESLSIDLELLDSAFSNLIDQDGNLITVDLPEEDETPLVFVDGENQTISIRSSALDAITYDRDSLIQTIDLISLKIVTFAIEIASEGQIDEIKTTELAESILMSDRNETAKSLNEQ